MVPARKRPRRMRRICEARLESNDAMVEEEKAARRALCETMKLRLTRCERRCVRGVEDEECERAASAVLVDADDGRILSRSTAEQHGAQRLPENAN